MKKVALVTGTSSGIGQDIARNLAKRGYDLILVARREERLNELAAELKTSFNADSLVLPCDLTNRDELNGLFARTTTWLEQGRALTILVNNAGAGVWAYFHKQSAEVAQRDIDLNVTALTILSRQFVDVATAHNQPSYILNVASMAGILPTPRYAVYSSTKAFVMRLTELVAYELRSTNIQVSCVCPGGVLTEFMDHSGQNLKGELGMMKSDVVANKAIEAMFKGKLFFVPGLMNKLTTFVRFLPRFVKLPAVERSMLLTVEDNGKGNG